ncbi:DUF3632 domain-containing protein [Aspergillus mulundensis]|uniref:Uncharacterized protein n=1 Tax=Aspergillus mulundensis TaxID=1810919 RepID=A0A3D8SCY6_9EURO|nr:Uncharacterized protein DSM5745_04523 [Aspergillus mulundensis]RDW84197.1 Uncharacterized protein DSM5745_04523 [Aspergillus mulundensis]
MATFFDIPGSNPPTPFSAPIQALLASTPPSSTPDETASHIVDAVTSSPDPSSALWQLWDAFFTTVVNSASHGPHLAFLDALRAQPPTQPTHVRAATDAESYLRSYLGPDGKLRWSKLPRFDWQWRDDHDILEAWRAWDGIREDSAIGTITSKLERTPAELFLRFIDFSTALLEVNHLRGGNGVSSISVFYACRNVLERDVGHSGLPRPDRTVHVISPDELWTLDVRVAATWMRDGGLALWEADGEDFRRHYAATLEFKTDLWPREDGLARERWELWGRRLRELSTDGSLDEETRAVVVEAAGVVTRLLEETDGP